VTRARHRLLSATVSTLALTVTLGSVAFAAPAGATSTRAAEPPQTSGGSADPHQGAAAVDATSAAAGPSTVEPSTSALATATLAQTQRYIIEFTPDTAVTQEATIHAARGMAVQNLLTNVFPG
jgi:hypothetical protein